MDTSPLSEYLMLTFIKDRGYVSNHELSQEARLWMDYFKRISFVSSKVMLVPDLPFLASGQTCYFLTVEGNRQIDVLREMCSSESDKSSFEKAKHSVSGMLLEKAKSLFEDVATNVISTLITRGL